MTDINPTPVAHADEGLIEIVELLFFAYRDFVSDPDEILAKIGFGRAHHRVIHFVGRNPGMSVAELLEILKITKQSLARVLRELIARDYIRQEEGNMDRRQRLLYLTPKGRELHNRLLAPQLVRLRRALGASGSNSERIWRQMLYNMIDAQGRRQLKLLKHLAGEDAQG
jgi:DNA-binding MarR family transcriptional regulator